MNRNNIGTGRILEGMGVLSAIFSSTFLVAFVATSQFAPVEDSSATDDNISVTNDARGYYADITSSGAIGIDVIADAEGQTEILADSLTVETNAKNGYKLFIATSGDNNALYLNGDSSETSSISAASSTAGALSTNTWGYVPARETSSGTAVVPTEDSATFKGVPTKGSDTLLYTNSAPTDSSTNTLDVYYGTKVDTKLPSGDYTLKSDTSGATPVTDTVVYTAVVDAVNGESTEASINPSWQEGLTGQNVTIATGLYPGYTAQEFSDNDWISVTIGGEECTNITPVITEIGSLNITCTAPTMASTGSKAVAVSIQPYGKEYALSYEYKISVPAFFTISTMQEMTHAICKDTNVPTPTSSNWSTIITKDGAGGTTKWAQGVQGTPQTTLVDDRNGQISYTVRKLADGECWMTENLRLPGGTTLYTTDSDIDGTIITSGSYTVPTSTSPFVNSPAQDVNQMNSDYTTTTDDPRGYMTGNYYSWRTATAGTGRGSSTSGGAADDVFGTNMNTQGNNTAVSICPKGWRLPTGGANAGSGSTGSTPGSTAGLVNGDFARLNIAYGGTGSSGTGGYADQTSLASGPQLALGGVFNAGGRASQGSGGYYWSSTVFSYQNAYRLFLSTSNVDPQDFDYKYIGYSVRCIAR